VTLQKLTTVLALVALVVVSAGDSATFCRMACASGAWLLGSSNMPTAHHDGHPSATGLMHHHMAMTGHGQSAALNVLPGMVVLELPQCSQFPQSVALLNIPRIAAKGLSDSGAVAVPAQASLVEGTTQATLHLTESPPGSTVPLRSTSSILRI